MDYYTNQRFQESLKNITPADVYFGRDKEIIEKRNILKEQTLALRRQQYQQSMGKSSVNNRTIYPETYDTYIFAWLL